MAVVKRDGKVVGCWASRACVGRQRLNQTLE